MEKKKLFGAWTGFTRFIKMNERPPDWVHMVRRETDEEANDLKTRQLYGQICGKHVSDAAKIKAKQKMDCRETKAR